jgi:autotransporter-associated beta strand protein
MSSGTRSHRVNRLVTTRQSSYSRRRAILAVSAAALSVSSIARADKTWNGGGPTADTGSWTTALNWVGGIAPTPNTGEILTFDGFAKTTNMDNFAAGSGFGGLVFASTAGAFTLTGNQLKLQGDITDNAPVVTQTIGLPLLLDATRNITVTDGGFLNISGVISDGGSAFGITKNGNGTLTLLTSNAFTGPITINAGALSIGTASFLGGTTSNGQIVINGGGLFLTASQTIPATHSMVLGPSGGAGSGTIDIAANTTGTFGGIISNNTAGGIGSLNKTSFGTLVLSGANTFSGTTGIKNGTLVLNFADTAATTPTSNIINASSPLTLGGLTAGLGTTSYSRLIINGKASVTNSQTFASTFLDLGPAVIQDTSGASGTANLNLGALTHTPGSVLTLGLPTLGTVNTTTTNTNGILGGWATIGTTTAAVNGVIQGTDLETVDGTGKISAYTGYKVFTANTTLSTSGVLPSDNIRLNNASTATDIAVAPDNANTTVDINSFSFQNTIGGTGTTSIVHTLNVGVGNTLRLGKYGTIFRQDTGATNNIIVGGPSGGPSSSNSTIGNQDIGFLTAGGPDIGGVNQPGEIIFNISSSSETTGTMRVDTVIKDNGTAPVTVVKTGAGSMKFDAHNTFSGGLYILQGRLQFTGQELSPGAASDPTYINPNAGGMGAINIFPGAQWFPSGAGSFFAPGNVTNAINLAGNGINADGTGAIRMGGGLTLSGPMTLTGAARVGGGGGNVIIGNVTAAGTFTVGGTTNQTGNLGGNNNNNPGMYYSFPSMNPAPGTALVATPAALISGKISGPYLMSFGASGNAGGAGTNVTISNTNNNWTGDTQIEARENGASPTTLYLNADNVIPDGHGFGNVTFGTTGANSGSVHTLNMNGHSDTINGLSTASDGHPENAFIENDSFNAVVAADGKSYTFTPGTTSTLTVGNDNQSSTFGGTIRDASPATVYLPNPAWGGAADPTNFGPSGPDASGNTMTLALTPAVTAGTKMAITKIGGGILTLTNTNTYTGDTNINGGTLNVNGSLATAGAVKINNGGALSGSGTVGNVTLATGGAISPGNNGLGNINTIHLNSLTATGGGLSLDIGAGNSDVIQVANGASFSGNTPISTFGSPIAGTYTILTASSTTINGGASFTVTPPPAVFGTRPVAISLVNPATTPGQLQLSVVGGAKFLNWEGTHDNTWDLASTFNWQDNTAASERFFNGDLLNFFDGAANRNINLTGVFSPGSVEFNNTGVNDYSLGGTGLLTGVMSLQKDGDATLTISTANNYSGTSTFNSGTVIFNGNNSTTGPMFIAGSTVIYSALTAQTGSVNLGGGTLMLNNGASLGTSSINVNGGNFVINRTDTSTLGNVVGGTGGEIDVVGNGTVTFSGANTYGASTKIQAGKVIVTNNNSLGTISGGEVDISSGAALDLSGAAASISFGGKTFHIQGSGPDGNGVIVNNGVSQQAAFQQVILDNDATIGVSQRFDVRTAVGSQGDLNPQGHTLTKLGTAQFSVVNSDINDGNLDIKAGTVSFEGSTTSSGTGLITLEDGTAAQIFQLVNEGSFNKPIQINGNVQLGTGSASESYVNSNITFNGDLKIGLFSGNATLKLDGNLIEQNGPRNFVKTGVSSVMFDGQSVVYTGTTTISAGTLIIGNGDSNGSLGLGAVSNSGALVFNRGDTATYTAPISGTGALYQTGSGTTILSGNQTYTGPTSITQGNLVTATKFGSGTLTINNGNGIIAQKANNGAANGVGGVKGLSINGGYLDITNNGLIVDYTPGSSPLAAIKQYISNGYNSGNYNGTGNSILSTTAGSFNSNSPLHPRAIGYAEASAIGIVGTGNFMGQTVDDSSVLIRYTVNADANLDGTVNALDLNALATNFGTNAGNNVWSGGDFNNDGNVDTSDFMALSQNFGQSLPATAPAPVLGTLVPEPASLAMLTLGAGLLGMRRRRR